MIDTDNNFLWLHLFMSGLYLILGLHFIYNPPKDLTTPTGLNNPPISKAKLNMDTWTYLHNYIGKVMIICGIVYLTVNLLLNYLIELSELSASKIEGLNLIILMITSYAILVIIPFYSTETHMNKTFDKNGNRKQKN